MIKICPICKRKFDNSYGYRKYCSKECRKIARKNWVGKYNKDYGMTNKEKLKQFRIVNKELIAQKERIYSLTPEGIYKIIKTSSKCNDRGLLVSKEDFIKWYNEQEQKCYYCNRTLEEIKEDTREEEIYKRRLSIDRKDNKIGYTLDNIVLACRRCNTIKSNYFNEKEMLVIGKILYNKG